MAYEYGGRNTRTFAKLPGYKNLVVWQKGSDLSTLVNEAVKHFGSGYFRLIDQMRGAAISITANIAEGYCSASVGNYIRYCLTARGSLGELGSYIQDCERWGLLKGEALDKIAAIYADTTLLLDRLIQSLRQKEQDGTWDKQFWIKEESAQYDVAPEP
ncbi:MAG: four helix bundle protein [Chloroflexota bacterium]